MLLIANNFLPRNLRDYGCIHTCCNCKWQNHGTQKIQARLQQQKLQQSNTTGTTDGNNDQQDVKNEDNVNTSDNTNVLSNINNTCNTTNDNTSDTSIPLYNNNPTNTNVIVNNNSINTTDNSTTLTPSTSHRRSRMSTSSGVSPQSKKPRVSYNPVHGVGISIQHSNRPAALHGDELAARETFMSHIHSFEQHKHCNFSTCDYWKRCMLLSRLVYAWHKRRPIQNTWKMALFINRGKIFDVLLDTLYPGLLPYTLYMFNTESRKNKHTVVSLIDTMPKWYVYIF